MSRRVINDVIGRIRFWIYGDRIGSDMPLTYWMLYFPQTMRYLCKKRFKKFGERSEFRPGSYALDCRRIIIGNDVVIRPQSILMPDPRKGGAEIIIEDKVLMGPGVHIYVNDHVFAEKDIPIYDQDHTKPNKNDTVILRKGCWIGARSTILKGVEVGRNAVVAAGSVVTRDVEDHTLVAGIPAKILKKI